MQKSRYRKCKCHRSPSKQYKILIKLLETLLYQENKHLTINSRTQLLYVKQVLVRGGYYYLLVSYRMHPLRFVKV